MREMVFCFSQDIVVKLGLNLQELLVLDYLITFFDSGKQAVINVNQKKYGWINYKKMILDLPILNLGERALRSLFERLEKKNIISRYQKGNKRYININTNLLFFGYDDNGVDYLTNQDKQELEKLGGTNIPQNEENGKSCEFSFRPCGTSVPAIVYYYNNKIKIIVNKSNVEKIDGGQFLFFLKSKLRDRISELNYDICIKNMKINIIAENLIVLSCVATSVLKLNTNGEFEKCVFEVLEQLLETKK